MGRIFANFVLKPIVWQLIVFFFLLTTTGAVLATIGAEATEKLLGVIRR